MINKLCRLCVLVTGQNRSRISRKLIVSIRLPNFYCFLRKHKKEFKNSSLLFRRCRSKRIRTRRRHRKYMCRICWIRIILFWRLINNSLLLLKSRRLSRKLRKRRWERRKKEVRPNRNCASNPKLWVLKIRNKKTNRNRHQLSKNNH